VKIDIHTHILPEKWPDLEARYGYGGFVRLDHHRCGAARMMVGEKFFREIESNCWDPGVRMSECEPHRVDVQVLSTVPVMFAYWARPEHGLDLARLLNDHIAEVVRAHPRRFQGLGTVPMQAPDLAVRELERCVKQLGLRGIQIGSNVNGKNLDDPSIFPVFEAAAELGASVFVHPWEMLGQERLTKYWMQWLVGMPAETTLAICSVIFSGVLERLPKLRIAFAHGGGAFGATLGRIDHGFHARPDLCQQENAIAPRTYLGRFYVDTLVHDPAMLCHLVKIYGKNRVALGTDYPFPLGELEPGRLITECGFDDDVREWLESRTALEWLGMEANHFLGGGA
jgi:aminocarboxymuconate-semialdehyde decarboxylase